MSLETANYRESLAEASGAFILDEPVASLDPSVRHESYRTSSKP
jgi:hypothetical protein